MTELLEYGWVEVEPFWNLNRKKEDSIVMKGMQPTCSCHALKVASHTLTVVLFFSRLLFLRTTVLHLAGTRTSSSVSFLRRNSPGFWSTALSLALAVPLVAIAALEVETAASGTSKLMEEDEGDSPSPPG